MHLQKFIRTIWIITLSRFKKEKNDQWIKDRRAKCKLCPFNTKNMVRVPQRELYIKILSDFYSKITGNAEVDNLGNCSECDSCSVYFKTREGVEECPKEFWEE